MAGNWLRARNQACQSQQWQQQKMRSPHFPQTGT